MHRSDELDLSGASETLVVRVGCELAYSTDKAMPALFLIQPHKSAGTVLEEGIVSNTGAIFESSVDTHGNPVLRTVLVPGCNEFRYEAVLKIRPSADIDILPARAAAAMDMPADVMRYTLPSRYCESDKLVSFAKETFGHLPGGAVLAQSVCDWVHHHFEYRYGSGDSSLSAWEALQRGYGVCRDFAHLFIALCRALDLPARYVAGYIPIMQGNEVDGENDIGVDFHAYVEVYLNGIWHTFDARYGQPPMGRVKIAHGMDAVDAAFATFYGNVTPRGFKVWAEQIAALPDYSSLLRNGMNAIKAGVLRV